MSIKFKIFEEEKVNTEVVVRMELNEHGNIILKVNGIKVVGLSSDGHIVAYHLYENEINILMQLGFNINPHRKELNVV
jgi:hypothetical protein